MNLKEYSLLARSASWRRQLFLRVTNHDTSSDSSSSSSSLSRAAVGARARAISCSCPLDKNNKGMAHFKKKKKKMNGCEEGWGGTEGQGGGGAITYDIKAILVHM